MSHAQSRHQPNTEWHMEMPFIINGKYNMGFLNCLAWVAHDIYVIIPPPTPNSHEQCCHGTLLSCTLDHCIQMYVASTTERLNWASKGAGQCPLAATSRSSTTHAWQSLSDFVVVWVAYPAFSRLSPSTLWQPVEMGSSQVR